MLGLKRDAQKAGFQTEALKVGTEYFKEHAEKFPCIVHWNKNHFVVVYKRKRKGETCTFYVSDPAFGRIKYTEEEFFRRWCINEGDRRGFVLYLVPGDDFGAQAAEKKDVITFKDIFLYLKPYYPAIIHFFTGMLVASGISLVFPFLTQSIVDVGIQDKNLHFIMLLLVAQLVLVFGQTVNDMVRSWLMLHMTSKMSIRFIADFLFKLIRLPIAYFDVKKTGDILQRISDNTRIQSFLTSTLVSIVIAGITFLVYAVIMANYDLWILGVFLFGSVLYVLWITFFLRRRKELDKKRFEESASNQNNIIELITGMQEIKLNNCENRKLWEWERIQARLYNIGIKSLALDQMQNIGGTFINQIKNILISYMAARLVVNAEMTLGMMMAMQYVIGQLNAPLMQFIGFIGNAQDAKISLERLNEIYGTEDEEPDHAVKDSDIPVNGDISFEGVTFRYEEDAPVVLDDISFTIEAGKVNAIVGVSGSGKTTLLKLLLGFYKPDAGRITVGGKNIRSLSAGEWRKKCGIVMQEGFIFCDTILRNVAVGDEEPDMKRFYDAVRMAHIDDFIAGLPMCHHTVIGVEGVGLSTGQKQRILIARAIYKNPAYIFMDEATNALDTKNEKAILNDLNTFFAGRTVMIIAHRLSTIKNADRIFVLSDGVVAESGTHRELTVREGVYYQLVQNQVELNRVSYED